MKKLLQLIAATLVTLTVGFVPAASAATCTITTTGPNSNNTCVVNDTNTVTITCTNGVNVSNVNSQSAVSGSVNVSGNTVSGTATSGDAANINQVATELSQSCEAAPATTPTPATTAPVASGGQGAVAAAVQQTPKVAALPNTGPSTAVNGIVVSALLAGSLAGLSHVALSIYRRRAFKA